MQNAPIATFYTKHASEAVAIAFSGAVVTLGASIALTGAVSLPLAASLLFLATGTALAWSEKPQQPALAPVALQPPALQPIEAITYDVPASTPLPLPPTGHVVIENVSAFGKADAYQRDKVIAAARQALLNMDHTKAIPH